MDIENKKYKTQNQLKLSKYKEKRELADYLDTLSKKVQTSIRVKNKKEAQIKNCEDIKQNWVNIQNFKKQQARLVGLGQLQHNIKFQERVNLVQRVKSARTDNWHDQMGHLIVQNQMKAQQKKKRYAKSMEILNKSLEMDLATKQIGVKNIMKDRVNLKVQNVEMIKKKYVMISDRVEKETLFDIHDISLKKQMIKERAKQQKLITKKVIDIQKKHQDVRQSIDELFKTVHHKLGKAKEFKKPNAFKEFKSKFEIFNLDEKHIMRQSGSPRHTGNKSLSNLTWNTLRTQGSDMNINEYNSKNGVLEDLEQHHHRNNLICSQELKTQLQFKIRTRKQSKTPILNSKGELSDLEVINSIRSVSYESNREDIVIQPGDKKSIKNRQRNVIFNDLSHKSRGTEYRSKQNSPHSQDLIGQLKQNLKNITLSSSASQISPTAHRMDYAKDKNVKQQKKNMIMSQSNLNGKSSLVGETMVSRKIGFSTLYKVDKDYKVPLQHGDGTLNQSQDINDSNFYIESTERNGIKK